MSPGEEADQHALIDTDIIRRWPSRCSWISKRAMGIMRPTDAIEGDPGDRADHKKSSTAAAIRARSRARKGAWLTWRAGRASVTPLKSRPGRGRVVGY